MKSQNLLQHLVYALITVVITVHAFVFYSLYVVEGDALMQATGTSSVLQAIDSQGGVYMFGTHLPIWLVIVIETVCAFVLAVLVGSPLAFRLAIRRIFPVDIALRDERNATKTVKPADETEAIADVIIREKEIAAGE